jgi:hypothetical protein
MYRKFDVIEIFCLHSIFLRSKHSQEQKSETDEERIGERNVSGAGKQ